MTTLRRYLSPLAAAAALFPSVVLAAGLENPLSSQFSTIPNFIAGALKALVIVALPIISLFVVYAGFMFIMARGKPDALAKARQNFLYVIIGALLVLGAWALANLIGGTVSQIVGS